MLASQHIYDILFKVKRITFVLEYRSMTKTRQQMRLNNYTCYCSNMDLLELKNQLICSGESDEDIQAALDYAHNLNARNLPVIFDVTHFALLQGLCEIDIKQMTKFLEKHYYHLLVIPKKRGGTREINVPCYELKIIQKWILNNILYSIPVSEYAHGFCIKRSIKSNATAHLNQECLINLDIKDFFTSIDRKRIYNLFYYCGYTAQISNLLSRLCTYENHLPQGGVTSPYLSNLICSRLDKRLASLAKKWSAVYTRYADDITISGNKGISRLLPLVNEIIENEGFQLNQSKSRIQYKNNRQEITGLTINGGKIHVNKKYIKRFKQEIYYCEKYGPSEHLKHEKINKTNIHDHMYGKAYYIKMIDYDLGCRLIARLDRINWEK